MAKSATPADLQIKPRDLHIDREAATPRWWLNDDPFGTAVMNALSLTFPDGERFFIQSVKRFAKDARLDLEVGGGGGFRHGSAPRFQAEDGVN